MAMDYALRIAALETNALNGLWYALAHDYGPAGSLPVRVR